ncbi:MAG: RNA-directed DNA polymerase [Acidimicrobiia bacterium]|nr:RNA-directed DNA polymerase [Acidimicrobiia bacterium]
MFQSNRVLTPRDLKGGHLPGRRELELAANASRDWAQSRDIPDPLGFADLAHDAELLRDVVKQRAIGGRFPRRVVRCPLPKRGGLRVISCLDPIDEIALRVLVGRCVPAISQKLIGGAVLSHPLTSTDQGWQYVDHREAARRRREQGLVLLRDTQCAGLGTFDVTNYYGSVDLGRLGGALGGAPPGAVDALIEILRALPGAGGCSGLPVGFEGSGCLGGVYLLPADQVLASRRLGLIRWTDDSWLFLRRRVDWHDALNEYEDRLEALGLQLNRDKSAFHSKLFHDPESIISNGTIDSIVVEGEPVDVDAGRRLLLEELDRPDSDVDFTVLRFALKSLERELPPDTAAIVVDNPRLWSLVPKECGDLLGQLARVRSGRRQIDEGWLIERITSPCEVPAEVAGKVHAARVATKLRLGAAAGEELHGVATSAEPGHYPVRPMAALAWTKSDHWKPSRAVEGALDAGHLTLQRSFIAGFKKRSDYKARQKDWKRLRAEEPDLAPTLAWAAA